MRHHSAPATHDPLDRIPVSGPFDRDTVERLLVAQDGLVARWQLVALGAGPAAAATAVGRLRRVHTGVYRSGHGRLEPILRWRAATLSTPTTSLALASAGAYYEIATESSAFVTVLRPGHGGPRRVGGLLVAYSLCLPSTDLIVRDGILVTTPERTSLDLARILPRLSAERAVREALRRRLVTPESLLVIADREHGRRGAARLRAFAERYAGLAAQRTRSDPELLGAALLREAGLPSPAINVRRGEFEADLSWPQARTIIELDGPQFHLPGEDELRDAAWRKAGWSVHRLSTDTPYDEPERLIAVARAALARGPAQPSG